MTGMHVPPWPMISFVPIVLKSNVLAARSSISTADAQQQQKPAEFMMLLQQGHTCTWLYRHLLWITMSANKDFNKQISYECEVFSRETTLRVTPSA